MLVLLVLFFLMRKSQVFYTLLKSHIGRRMLLKRSGSRMSPARRPLFAVLCFLFCSHGACFCLLFRAPLIWLLIYYEIPTIRIFFFCCKYANCQSIFQKRHCLPQEERGWGCNSLLFMNEDTPAKWLWRYRQGSSLEESDSG